MSNASDFIIENGVLTKYVGPGGDVVIPDGVTEIGFRAFKGITGLTGVTIPKGMIEIGRYSFEDCISLTSITIPEDVRKIGWNAFEDCIRLTDVTFSGCIVKIEEYAFIGCTKLSNITILGGKVSGIGSALPASGSLRFHVSNLALLPPVLRPIAVISFSECDPDTDPCREAYLKYIKSHASQLMDLAIDNEALLSLMCSEKLILAKNAPLYLEAAQKSGNAQAIAMLLEYNATQLTVIEKDRAERQKKSVEDTVMDRKIKRQNKIGIDGLSFVLTGDLRTFETRKELKSFIETRGGKLMSSISSKTDYLIMNDTTSDTEKKKRAEDLGVEIITEGQFNEKVGRIYLINENGVLCRYYGKGGDVTVPEGVTAIGNKAFYRCYDLSSVVLPTGISYIDDSAFDQCHNLASITISDGVKEIGTHAFDGCRSLSSIIIPEGVTSIGDMAFYGCHSLTNIVIPTSIKNIGISILEGCSNLVNFIIPDGITSIPQGMFRNCSRLSHVTLPVGLTYIHLAAFCSCTALTSFVVPNGVTSINSWAFCGCRGLTTIIIPDSVRYISRQVFDCCCNLTIHAPAGSYAEQYAKENNIPFVAEG